MKGTIDDMANEAYNLTAGAAIKYILDPKQLNQDYNSKNLGDSIALALVNRDIAAKKHLEMEQDILAADYVNPVQAINTKYTTEAGDLIQNFEYAVNSIHQVAIPNDIIGKDDLKKIIEKAEAQVELDPEVTQQSIFDQMSIYTMKFMDLFIKNYRETLSG